ncbi:glycosyltransferase family 2 protein [Jannaschia formosa]|uniref:glycosyltransferase family 2 protein n=1 Tax=Jannaschia formosa TaxID=2259592 RepID=UPI000E1C2019|nr:glycosyltransferase family 2 protein [Jannaschia formosa]TFL17133.1 glycosyltransferase family 2 protein [Jannaschia formosa]
MQAAPRFAVIIPHYDDPVRLTRCLEALEPQGRDDVECVVVDNASPAGLDGVRARFPWARVLVEPTRGAGPARNRGVAETAAPWLLFVDADCVPAPDWLEVARRLATDPGIVRGGRVDVFDETPPPRSGAQAFETVFAFDMEGYVRRKGFLGSGNLLVARETFAAVGPFGSVEISEDVDWSRRAAAAGFALAYARDLAVAHPTRADWPALAAKWRRTTREGRGLAARGGTRMRAAWALRALAMPLSVPVHAPRVLRHPALSRGEKARALLVLLRLRLARMGWMLGRR